MFYNQQLYIKLCSLDLLGKENVHVFHYRVCKTVRTIKLIPGKTVFEYNYSFFLLFLFLQSNTFRAISKTYVYVYNIFDLNVNDILCTPYL